MRNWIRRHLHRIILVVLLLFVFYYTDIPPKFGLHWAEIAEAKALAKMFKIMAPEAMELVERERLIANEMLIYLEEADDLNGKNFGSCLDRLVEIMTKRKAILATLKESGMKPGAGWKYDMVLQEQKGALEQIKTELARTAAWIEIAVSARLRYGLRTKAGVKIELPELAKLKHQLSTFLTQPPEEPLNEQANDLIETYSFKVRELFQGE